VAAVLRGLLPMRLTRAPTAHTVTETGFILATGK
jgi:hypothetical protein